MEIPSTQGLWAEDEMKFMAQQYDMAQQAAKDAICDDCGLIPYDMGIGVVHEWDYEDLDELEKAEEIGRRQQVAYMVEVGGMIADHACSAKTEPDLNIQCDCACNR